MVHCVQSFRVTSNCLRWSKDNNRHCVTEYFLKIIVLYYFKNFPVVRVLMCRLRDVANGKAKTAAHILTITLFIYKAQTFQWWLRKFLLVKNHLTWNLRCRSRDVYVCMYIQNVLRLLIILDSIYVWWLL